MTLSPRLLVAPLAVAAVVGAALLAGDHDDDVVPAGIDAAPTSPPTPGSFTPAEFCTGFDELAAAQQAHLVSSSPDTVRELKGAATAVRDLAAGTTMPQTALAGVDFVVAAFVGLPDDAGADDLMASDDDATLADDAHAQALATYVGEHCR